LLVCQTGRYLGGGEKGHYHHSNCIGGEKGRGDEEKKHKWGGERKVSLLFTKGGDNTLTWGGGRPKLGEEGVRGVM